MSETVTPASGLADEMRDTAMMQEEEEDGDDDRLDVEQELEEEQSEQDILHQAEQARPLRRRAVCTTRPSWRTSPRERG